MLHEVGVSFDLLYDSYLKSQRTENLFKRRHKTHNIKKNFIVRYLQSQMQKSIKNLQSSENSGGRGESVTGGKKMMPNPRDKYRVFQEE